MNDRWSCYFPIFAPLAGRGKLSDCFWFNQLLMTAGGQTKEENISEIKQ